MSRHKIQLFFLQGGFSLNAGQITRLRRAALLLSSAVLLCLFLRYGLPLLGPFLLAFVLAALMEPAIRFVQERLRFQRGFTAAVLTLALTGLLLGLDALAVTALIRQLCQLPDYLSQLPQLAEQLEARLDSFLGDCPPNLHRWLDKAASLLWQQAAALAGKGAALLARGVSSLPRLFLFAAVTFLATIYTAADYPAVCAFLHRQLPPTWRKKLAPFVRTLRTALAQWLRAQLILIGTTFGLLFLGFLLLRQPFALLLALVMALLDALPVLGIGLALLPWSLLCLLTGQILRAIALLGLWGLITVIRGLLEPKVMAAQAGLPPLAALLAMYAGFAAFGVPGMVLLPLALLVLTQLRAAGLVQGWK